MNTFRNQLGEPASDIRCTSIVRCIVFPIVWDFRFQSGTNRKFYTEKHPNSKHFQFERNFISIEFVWSANCKFILYILKTMKSNEMRSIPKYNSTFGWLKWVFWPYAAHNNSNLKFLSLQTTIYCTVSLCASNHKRSHYERDEVLRISTKFQVKLTKCVG